EIAPVPLLPDVPIHYRVVRFEVTANSDHQGSSAAQAANSETAGSRKSKRGKGAKTAGETGATAGADQQRLIAFGRDLTPVANLQATLLKAQRSVDIDYQQLRLAETHYRALFHQTRDPVLIVDMNSERILEANRVAMDLLAVGKQTLQGRHLARAFSPSSRDEVRALLLAVRSAGQIDTPELAGPDGEVFKVDARLYRQQQSAFLLLMLVRQMPAQQGSASDGEGQPGSALYRGLSWDAGLRSDVLALIERGPDAFLLVSDTGLIKYANTAFLEMINGSVEAAVIDAQLANWIGHPGADWSALKRQIDETGRAMLFATTVTGDLGVQVKVEISGVGVRYANRSSAQGGQDNEAETADTPRLSTSAPGGSERSGTATTYGLLVRNVETRLGEGLATSAPVPAEMPSVVEQMAKQVGRVPLKDLVRDTTDIIERMCIEAALIMTDGNRASAAEVLGLSRQSLYVKLRRYGIGDETEDTSST
ncbi:MAG: helix-turn-helix domain-containing protein, partial [Pseudomonadota bacterium]